MSDRTFYRILGGGALAVACGFAARCGWTVAINDAAATLVNGAAALLLASAAVILLGWEGGDDGTD